MGAVAVAENILGSWDIVAIAEVGTVVRIDSVVGRCMLQLVPAVHLEFDIDYTQQVELESLPLGNCCTGPLLGYIQSAKQPACWYSKKIIKEN